MIRRLIAAMGLALLLEVHRLQAAEGLEAKAPAPPAATASLEVIESGIAKTFDYLHHHSVAVEYRVDFEYDDPERDPLAFLWEKQRFVMEESLTKYYGRREAIHRQLDHSDPYQIDSASYDGKQARQLDESKESTRTMGTVYKDLNKFGAVFWLDRYMEKFGYPIRPRDKESGARNDQDWEWLPTCFKKLKYSVAPYQEQVDGDWCHVVEAEGQDKLWIDDAHGFLLRKRLFKISKDVVRSFPWFAWTEVTNTDLEKVAEGLWLPRRCIVERFDAATAGESFRSKRAQKEVLVASSIEVGRTLPENQFVIEFPVKTYVGDVDTGKSYVITPNNIEMIDVSIRNATTSLKPRSGSRMSMLMIVNCLVLGGGLIAFFARRMRTT